MIFFSCVKDDPGFLEKKEGIVEVIITWNGCRGIKLTEDEIKDVEELCDCIMNEETHFDDSDAWVMEILLFMLL